MNLESIAIPVLEPLGFELLEVQVQNPGRRPTVVIRIDRLDEQPVTLADIELASHTLSLEFDRLDPITGEYRLEVESPGPKRPLKRSRHYERLLGLKIKVRSANHSFTAALTAIADEQATFECPEGPVTLHIRDIQASLAEWPDSHR